MSECAMLTLPELNKLVTLVVLHMAEYIESSLRTTGAGTSWDCPVAEAGYNELDAILTKLVEMRKERLA